MSLISPIPRWEIVDKVGKLLPQWQAYLSQIDAFIVRFTGQNGVTASRPTNNLYVGLQYFDTTLGKPIWVKTAGSSPVWVDATGASV